MHSLQLQHFIQHGTALIMVLTSATHFMYCWHPSDIIYYWQKALCRCIMETLLHCLRDDRRKQTFIGFYKQLVVHWAYMDSFLKSCNEHRQEKNCFIFGTLVLVCNEFYDSCEGFVQKRQNFGSLWCILNKEWVAWPFQMSIFWVLFDLFLKPSSSFIKSAKILITAHSMDTVNLHRPQM